MLKKLNGLKFWIQEELALVRMCDVEDGYQFALNVEEILNRKVENKKRWRDHGGRTRGMYYQGQKNN